MRRTAWVASVFGVVRTAGIEFRAVKVRCTVATEALWMDVCRTMASCLQTSISPERGAQRSARKWREEVKSIGTVIAAAGISNLEISE